MTWYNASWTSRVKITIQSSEVPSDQTDFPVYVDLSDLPAVFHTNVKTDGGDIRVTKSDGTTEVAREVVFYDDAADTGELHFKADGTLSSSSDTEFYIYYGNSGASDYAVDATYGAENVWTDYLGVWHFEEDPSGSAPQMLDSTSANRDGTSYGSMLTEDSVAGKLAGNALDFDGSNDEIRTSSTGLPGGSSARSVTFWMYNTRASGNQGHFGYGQPTNYKLFDLITYTSAGSMGVHMYSNNTGYNEISYSNNTWEHVAIVLNGPNDFVGYVNGLVEDNTYAGTPNTNAEYNDLRIGWTWYTSGIPAFQGKMDEFRIASGSLSADWITTEHSNQNDTSTFYSVGAEESAGSGAIYYSSTDLPESIKVDGICYQLTEIVEDTGQEKAVPSSEYDSCVTCEAGEPSPIYSPSPTMVQPIVELSPSPSPSPQGLLSPFATSSAAPELATCCEVTCQGGNPNIQVTVSGIAWPDLDLPIGVTCVCPDNYSLEASSETWSFYNATANPSDSGIRFNATTSQSSGIIYVNYSSDRHSYTTGITGRIQDRLFTVYTAGGLTATFQRGCSW